MTLMVSPPQCPYLFQHEVAVLLRTAGDVKKVAHWGLIGEHRVFVLDLVLVVQGQSPDLLLQPLVLRHAEVVRICGNIECGSASVTLRMLLCCLCFYRYTRYILTECCSSKLNALSVFTTTLTGHLTYPKWSGFKIELELYFQTN